MERFFHFWKPIRDFLSKILDDLLAISIAVLTIIIGWADSTSLVILLIAVIIFLELFKRSRRRSLTTKLGESAKEIRAREDQIINLTNELTEERTRTLRLKENLDTLASQILVKIADDVGLWTKDERITIYVPSGENFIALMRVSKNVHLSKKSRNLYPMSCGYIAETWNTGDQFQQNVKGKNADRKLEACMSSEEIAKIRFKLRCFSSIRLTDPSCLNKYLGVLFAESSRSKGITVGCNDDIKSHPLFPLLNNFIRDQAN